MFFHKKKNEPQPSENNKPEENTPVQAPSSTLKEDAFVESGSTPSFEAEKAEDSKPFTPAPETADDSSLKEQATPSTPTPNAPQQPIQILVQNNPAPNPTTNASEEPKKGNYSTGKKVGRVLLSLAVLGSFVLAGFSIYERIVFAQTEKTGDDSYITLNGMSVTESKKVYGEFGKGKQKKAHDISLVGTKLFVSESKITPSLYASSDTTPIAGGGSNFYLYNLTSDVPLSASAKSDFTHHKFYIDLNDLEEGDYLLYSDPNSSSDKKSDINPYSLSFASPVSLETYSLPNSKTGIRKRITIRNNEASPFLLINIKQAGTTLSSDYADAVLFASTYPEADGTFTKKEVSSTLIEHLNTLQKSLSESGKYQIKVVSSLEEAIPYHAPYAFAVSEDITGNLTSLFTLDEVTWASTYTTNVLSSSSTLAGYDANPEIRETVGYLDQAGRSYADVIGNDTTYHATYQGKESFLFASTSDDTDAKLMLSLLSHNDSNL
ncbi:MAG: hypothetical protein PUA93_01700 [Eubacteriales bacterium]|nr:hypothetical protein [Eubacteriales bacterium]